MRKFVLNNLWPLMNRVVQRWNDEECFTRSAALAYYGALSLFPLCLVLLATLGYVSRLSTRVQLGQTELLDVIERATSPWLADQVGFILTGVKSQAGIGGPVGLITLLLAAIGIFVQLEASIDKIWGTKPSNTRGLLATLRSVVVERLMAFLMFLAFGLLLGGVLVANLIFVGVRRYFDEWTVGTLVWQVAQVLLTPAIYMLLFTVIYKVLPKATVRWSEAWRGGVLVAGVWWLGQYLLQVWVIGDQYTAYGLIGSFIAVLAWLYYASAATFLGAIYVQVTCASGRRNEDRPPS